MTESWRQLMDVGIVHFMAFPEGDPVEQIRALGEDDFFDVVEIKPYDEPILEQIKDICAQAGMSVGIATQPLLLGGGLSLNTPDAAGRTAAIDTVKKGIDAAYYMESKLAVCLSGKMPEDEADIPAQMDLMVDSCVQLCQYAQDKAEDYCVWLSVEQFDNDTDKACLIGPADLTAQLAERVRETTENFGITADLSHLPMLPGSMTEIMSTLQPYLVHMHAGNCVCAEESLDLYGDLHPRFGYPGSEVDVPELKKFIETLIYIGYFESDVPTEKPILTFEVKPYNGDTSELIIGNTKRKFKQAWAAL